MIRNVELPRMSVLAVLAALALPSVAWGQTSTGSIRGHITGAGGAPVPSAIVAARNPATNIERTATSSDMGFYNLAGLTPGRYALTVRRIGFAPQSRDVQVGIGQTLTIDVRLADTTVTLERVVVVAEPVVVETRTSEVATNITPEQIENLPQGNRNFLEFATLAPGIQSRGAGISAGGTSVDNANLFVDGATYKSDVLPGGVAGQDPSLSRQVRGVGRVVGNPFPQNAVQEFRVITQNYKAEYQKASGAVVTAATKSGSNEIHGDLFWYGQNEGLIARNHFLQTDPGVLSARQGVPNYTRSQFGGSLGGPLARDRTHYFVSYEGNFQKSDQPVRFTVNPGLPTLPDSIRNRGQGVFTLPLRSNLFFGKLTHHLSDRQNLMLTANLRLESDERFNGASGEAREEINNNVSTVVLRHMLTGQRYTNEAQINYQRFNWKAEPLNPGLVRREYQDWGITLGSAPGFQDFVQDRISLRNDLTKVAGSHVLKGGANVDFLRYDVDKRLNEVPVFRFHPNRPGSFNTPFEASLEIGQPDLKTTNQQVGAYLQDDWSIGERLLLNIGLRWDYEHNGLNNDFVTQRWVRDSVAEFLKQFPYFNINDYTTDGDDRPRFLKAFQPRLGFSLDLFGDDRTIVFGGGGLFYDRVNYNALLDEMYKVQRPGYTFRFVPPGTTPGAGEFVFDPKYYQREELVRLVQAGQVRPEVFLIKNSQKPPYTMQYSLGARHAFGAFNASATGTLVNGRNYLKWVWGHVDPATGNLMWGQVPGLGPILISTDEGRSWYRGLLLHLGKPMLGDSRWGGDLNYTLAKTEVNTYWDLEDPFALDYVLGHPVQGFRRIPGRFDERHRIVMNLATRLPLGIRASTVTTLGSGSRFTVTTGCQGPWDFPDNDPAAFCNRMGFPKPSQFIQFFQAVPAGQTARSGEPEGKWFGPFGKWAYRNVDLRVQKDFGLRGQTLGISVDVLNVFNFTNFNYAGFVYNLRWDTNQGAGPSLPVRPRGEYDTFDSRRVQLGLKYSF